MKIPRFLLAIALCLLAANLIAEDTGFPLHMVSGQVVAPIPGQMAIAAYISLENRSGETVTLAGASTEAAGHASLHRTESVDGMNRMQSVESIVIEEGELLEMKAGGLHLMLMEPDFQMLSSDSIELSIELLDGRTQTFQLPLVSIRDMPNHSSH